MESNRAAFDERGVRLIGVSVDPLAESTALAGRISLGYALAFDEDAKLAGKLVGIDQADIAIPGVVLLSKEGKVLFRQVASSKDDRISTSDLLAAIDQALGNNKTVGPVKRDFAPLQRTSIAVEVAPGLSESRTFAIAGRLTGNYPVLRNLTLGPTLAGWSHTTASHHGIDAGVQATLRFPHWHDIAAVNLSLGAARSFTWSDGARASGMAFSLTPSWWFAARPNVALQVGIAVSASLTSGEFGLRDVLVTIGAARLFQW